MATQTRVLGILSEPEGRATLSVDYDDALLRLTLLRIVNAHPTITARVTATADAQPSRTGTLDGLPNQTTTQALPTGQQTRLNITIDAQGRLDGVGYTFGWVVP